jgi:hypothetical protein
LLLACSLLPFLASCDGEQERHELTPDVSSIVLYADETIDSLRFFTFDSWTVTPQADWITVDGDSHLDLVHDNSVRYLCKVFFNVEPNTTGKTRTGTVLVQSYDYSFTSPFVQLGLLRLSHPLFTTDTWLNEQSGIPDVAHYELTDSAHWTSDSICFTVQSNWDLVFADEAPEWLELDNTMGIPGKYSVHLKLVPNTDKENGREARLKLVSGKVSNEIIVRQLPAKKEE